MPVPNPCGCSRTRDAAGAIEIAGALALFVPTLAPYGAMLLAVTMVCAVATDVLIVGGSPLPALVLLIASVAIAWARHDQLEPSAE